jgi:predicted nucleic-acid-binding protein
MIAIDTNVIVRALVNDDSGQAAIAAGVLRRPDLWISKTVLLETEWVLRSAYRVDRSSLNAGLRKLLGLPNVEVEDPAAVARAVEAHEAGMDFADALHLASSFNAEVFVTFDRHLSRLAEESRSLPVVELLET